MTPRLTTTRKTLFSHPELVTFWGAKATMVGLLLIGLRCDGTDQHFRPSDAGDGQMIEAATDLSVSDAANPPLDLGPIRPAADLRPSDFDGGSPVTLQDLCGQPAACIMAGTRELASWPFSRCSPWNMPIGEGAQAGVLSSPSLSNKAGDPKTTAAINSTSWSHPIYLEDPTGGTASMVSGNNELGLPVSFRLMLPSGIAPAIGTDGHLHIIDSSRTLVYEMYQAVVGSGFVQATDLIVNDLQGSGVFEGDRSPFKELWHGARAYGGSAIGGLIRKNELRDGIPHALAVAVQRAALNRNTPNGMGYVWPASYRDDGWMTSYGVSGTLHMGSLIAIAAGQDLQTLFSREGITDPAVQQIALSLQDYGAYVVDATSDNLSFYAEPAAVEAARIDDLQLARLIPYLVVVQNSTPSSVGGGGIPRKCLAPAIRSLF